MGKTLKKILIIIISFIFIYIYIGIESNVFASGISVSSSSVDIGGTTTISVSIPNGYVGYEGTITFDSSKLSYVSSSNDGKVSGNSIKIVDVNNNLEQVSNFSVTFKGNSEGSANVSVNLLLVDSNSGSNSANGSGTITVNSPKPAETPVVSTPEPNVPVSTPAPTPEPKPPKFTQVNETVYATKTMNVRESWSTNSKKIGGLTKGQEITRTGIGDNGWSRINYNGKTAYVSTGLITKEKPEEELTEQDDNNTENVEGKEEPDEKIEESEDKKIEEEIYQKLVDEIGTIPEVGNNINKYIFGFILIISIFSIILIFRKEA